MKLFGTMEIRKNELFLACVPTQMIFLKKVCKLFGNLKNCLYLCKRYPENNLFTLKETNT